MMCMRCGAAITVARENFLYTASGLPNVTLVGVEVRRCPSCGEFEVAIPRIEDLHRTIARPSQESVPAWRPRKSGSFASGWAGRESTSPPTWG